MKRHKRFNGAMTAVLLVACAGTGTAAHGQLVSTTTGKAVGTSTTTTTTSVNGTTTTTTTVTPLYRSINPFYRSINPFWGSINPFYRSINPFWGSINPFAGTINPFWGSINPFYSGMTVDTTMSYGRFGSLAPWWETTGSLWTQLDANWAAAGTDAYKLAQVRDQLRELNAHSSRFWGTTVQAKTGLGFDAGFSAALFSKHNINLNDPYSLTRLSPGQRSHFMMDWYDGLMSYSGIDIPDHWMKTANWNPRLTQEQNGGGNVTIGLIDTAIPRYVNGKPLEFASAITSVGGDQKVHSLHGAGVASLLVAPHDKFGVMGVAPNAKLATFNPFDLYGSTDWPRVEAGVRDVLGKGASVVNLSLGVPGSVLDAGWHGLFADKISDYKDKATYVIAAGNDGITQTQNIDWTRALFTSFIVVGSVDPNGNISEFSNRPGEACLLDGGVCKNSLKLNESGLIKHRFIVAPGELILVSDGKGGRTRLSGTSFAAPLVSGAIALLHGRWPWLKDKPLDTQHIILKSAKDLGAPGVDGVYGVGMLDVAASQSPLDPNALYYKLYQGTTLQRGYNGQDGFTGAQLKSIGGIQSAWVTGNMHFSAFEKLPNGERDFLIPLSSRIWGQTRDTKYLQKHAFDRIHSVFGGVKGLTDAPRSTGFAPTESGWSVSFAAGTPAQAEARGERSGFAVGTEMRMQAPGGRFGFSVGHGGGALGLNGGSGFAMSTDHDAHDGGVNPVLGFASGGAYAAAEVALGDAVEVSAGFTQRRRSRAADMIFARENGAITLPRHLERYGATAGNVRLDYRASRDLSLSASMTALGEDTGLLGVRSLEPTDLGDGSGTTAVTLGAELGVGSGVTLLASATGSRTAGDDGNALGVADGGLLGSAFQLGIAKRGLLGGRDQLRLSIAQPLTIEDGEIEFRSIGVIDRETGETGEFTQTVDAANGRRFVGEALYATPLLDGRGELSAFGRGELGGRADEGIGWTAGASLRLGF